jgi:lambda repressor-like predicted transcriptional regulator
VYTKRESKSPTTALSLAWADEGAMVVARVLAVLVWLVVWPYRYLLL